ncbi:MAG: 30S ribosomal protein S18 [bacterium]|nr:30S ribosomal protein S18 [bacterium]MDZ4296341.1 30S ribosomal protein S18 [Patescibacteria group bacterium]
MMKDCYFCKGVQKEIDYKDVVTLSKFIKFNGSITPARRNKSCAKHQRRLAKAVKRARQMGLLPYIAR